MKNLLFLLAIIALLASCTNPTTPEAPFSVSNLEVTSGNLWHADIFSPELNETIKIDVYFYTGYYFRLYLLRFYPQIYPLPKYIFE